MLEKAAAPLTTFDQGVSFTLVFQSPRCDSRTATDIHGWCI